MDFKPAKKDMRSLEQNKLIHAMFREILNHLIDNGVKLPPGAKGEAVIKALCKQKLGAKMRVNGIEIDTPTSLYLMSDDPDYEVDDNRNRAMNGFIGRIAAWAATDLNLVLEI